MELIEYIKTLGNVGVALSGGVDSSYLAYMRSNNQAFHAKHIL